MVQLRTQRTALILYGVLLVLPTLVLGGLQWRQLRLDDDAERVQIPQKAEEAANRFKAQVYNNLQRVIDAEEERPFFVYGSQMITSDASLAEATAVSTPLVSEKRPAPILAWFAFDLRTAYRSPVIDLWGGEGANREELAALYEPPVRELLRNFVEQGSAKDLITRWDPSESVDVSLLSVVFNRLHERDLDCLQYGKSDLALLKVTLEVTPFHLQFFVDQGGTGRLIATRRVITSTLPELDRFEVTCFESLSPGIGLVQGFLIDTDWFFRDLPAQLAGMVLDTSQRFVPWGGPPCCGDNREYHAEIRLIANLAIETNTPEEQQYAPLRIAVDSRAIDATQRRVRLSFLGLAAMLALSLGTGMWLLLRSVRRDLEQASRTENFVAAVTHELRTPLTSIKMYGEMLLDGEAAAPEQQREYYKRIVRASERLNTLVERVLEKARLTSGASRSEIGDLNAVVAGLERQLTQYGPDGDLAFELGPNLPEVLLTPEAASSIVSNLVENARKYAPVDPSAPGAEPILVRTRHEAGAVFLDVLDRGPGVPEGEEQKIFEAFYRVGSEATRRARGAGLGLHLVLLQARSLGGDAGYRRRPGGGGWFWVRFRPAAAEPAA